MSGPRALWSRTPVRLLTMVVAIVVAVVGGSGTYEVMRERRTSERAFAAASHAALLRLRDDLQYPLWHLERAAVERVVRHEMSSPDVRAVVVRDEHGETYYGLVRTPDGGLRGYAALERVAERDLEAGSIVSTGPIVERDEPIGAVTLVVSDARLRAEQRAAATRAALWLVLLVAILATVIFSSVQRVIVRPIQRLEAWVQALEADGGPPSPPPGGGAGEVAALAEAFGSMAARQRAAQAQLRALAARVQRAREEEKTRIARDLHDELGQLLTGLKLDLLWLEGRIEAMPPGPEVNALLERAVAAAELSDQTVTRVQQIATDLRPAALDRLGLGAALQQEARRFQGRTGVACEAWVPARLPPLAAEVTTALYRIAQEALTNVARHARASRVALRLARADGQLILAVEDDGVGLPVGPALREAARPHSLGMLGMMERAALLGGTVTFARREPRGTVVTARVPAAAHPEPDEVASAPSSRPA